MDRRALMLGLGLLVLPAIVSGQPARVRRIGVLAPEDLSADGDATFVNELSRRGWIEGSNLAIEKRAAAGDMNRLGGLAQDLVRLNVEVIVAIGTIAAQAAKAATVRIPIVFYASGDPVRAGLVESLARPGGNLSGTSLNAAAISLKRLELLREIIPGLTRVAMFINPANPGNPARRRDEIASVGRSLGVQVVFAEASDSKGLEPAMNEVLRQRCQAMIIPSEPLFGANFGLMESLIRRSSLPAMVDNLDEGAAALIAYGPDWPELARQTMSFVDRILKGANPGSLPVEEPTKYQLTVNLARAKGLGIRIPESMLLRADTIYR